MRMKNLMAGLALMAIVATLVAAPLATAGGGGGAIPCGGVPQSIAEHLQNNEAWYCPINQQIAAQWANSMPIAIVAVLLAFTVAAIIFMIGTAVKSDRVRNFGVGELYEALASAIIVAAFMYVASVVFGYGLGALVGPVNPYAVSFNLITNTVSTAEQFYGTLYHIYFLDSFYASINVNIYGDIESLGAGSILQMLAASNGALSLLSMAYKFPLIFFFIQPADLVSKLLSDGILALYGEYYLLVFFAVSAIPVFLVTGIVFRAIYPTRAFGGMLIALAIAFYLVMPGLFSIAYYFTTPQLQQQLRTGTSQLALYGSGSGAITNAQSSTSPIVETLGTVDAAMSSFWLLILFYPGLIIAVTYSFVTQIANFIGGASYTGSKLRSFI